jgi:DNA-binding winged helix-turn-helix (wHTH) protein
VKSSGNVLRFGDFSLDPANRILWRGGTVVELGGRYLDALLLLARESGQLISKERLLGEVWRGVPVTDEALTQCIRTLRRTLGDDAAAPRFIETVPKHGYRFVAKVGTEGGKSLHGAQADDVPHGSPGFVRWLILTGSGGLGGAAAGAAIGLIYGVLLADGTRASGTGLSLVAVVACCGALAGLFSALAIAAGVATADRVSELGNSRWIVGAAGGGLVAGSALNMIGRDAISLLFGRRLADLPGGLEGAVMGAVVGVALWWAARFGAAGVRAWAGASVSGALTGFILPLAGGTLFAGSLAALSATVPGSPFAAPLTGIWRLAVAGAFEGALFCVGVAAGLLPALGQAAIMRRGT